jgi:multidrug efflux pump subunit AcrB
MISGTDIKEAFRIGEEVKRRIMQTPGMKSVSLSWGLSTAEALRESVRVRIRTILMTAFGTAVGMLPIALERATGLERLSPLAVLSSGGLMLSTFLTLIHVPIFYTLFEDMYLWVKMAVPRGRNHGEAAAKESLPFPYKNN